MPQICVANMCSNKQEFLKTRLIPTESDESIDASQPQQDARSGPDIFSHVKESCKGISNPPKSHLQMQHGNRSSP